MEYTIFDTEAEVIAAIEICWIKYLKDKVVLGYTAVNGDEYTDLSLMSDSEICKLKLYGKKYHGTDDKEQGITINYQLYAKAHEQDKWYCPVPPAEYLALLSGYEIKTAQEIIDEGYYAPEE